MTAATVPAVTVPAVTRTTFRPIGNDMSRHGVSLFGRNRAIVDERLERFPQPNARFRLGFGRCVS